MMLDGGDSAIPVEEPIYRSKTKYSEELEDTCCVGETTDEEENSDVQRAATSLSQDVYTVKPEYGAGNGTHGVVVSAETESVVPKSDSCAADAAAPPPARRASAGRVLLSLAGSGALALVAADTLVGRPLQFVAGTTARFWAVGFTVGAIVLLTAASVGYKWRRRVNVHLPETLADAFPPEPPLELQIPADDRQTQSALSLLNRSLQIKQPITDDIVPELSTDHNSEANIQDIPKNFERILNENVVVL